MVFPQSKLPKFIVCSLIAHASVVAVLWKLEYQHEHQIPVEVTFSMGATGDGKAVGEKVVAEKKRAPQVKPIIRPEIKSEVIADTPKVESQEAVSDGPKGEGGTGTNIGTGKEGTGYGSVAGIESAKSKYFSLVAQTVNKSKRYPRQAYSLNQEGTVVLRVKLDKQGKVLDVKVLEKAPYKSLTNASLDAINSIKKFPPIPDELGVEEVAFNIPIEYKIQMQ
jgi:TonB family protein